MMVVAMIMIHKIEISEDGRTKVVWNNRNRQGMEP